MLDPFASIAPPKDIIFPAKTMIRFADNSPILVSGDAHGEITTYRLYG